MPDPDLIEELCIVMHDAYESRTPWWDVPEADRATMRRSVSALLDHLAATGQLKGGSRSDS